MFEDVRPATARDMKRLRQEKPYERVKGGRLMRVKDDNGNEYVQMRNSPTMVGKALDIGRAETLSIPAWSRRSFSAAPLNPLDMYAGSRLMAFGFQGAQGNRIPPWRKNRMGRGAQQMAQGRGMLYSPMGVGVMQ